MVGASHRNKLEDHPGQDVEHGAKGGVDERHDRSTTLEPLLLFGQDVASRELTTWARGPWVRFAMLLVGSWETGSKIEGSLKVLSIA